MKTRNCMTMVLFIMFNSVIFGSGALFTLYLAETATTIAFGIAASAIVGIVGGYFLARRVTPRLPTQYWHRQDDAPKAVWR